KNTGERPLPFRGWHRLLRPDRGTIAEGIRNAPPAAFAVGPERKIEVRGIAKLENLHPIRAGFVAIAMVGWNEHAVALAQHMGAHAQLAGEDIIETVRVMGVKRQYIAALEP